MSRSEHSFLKDVLRRDVVSSTKYFERKCLWSQQASQQAAYLLVKLFGGLFLASSPDSELKLQYFALGRDAERRSKVMLIRS